MKKKETLILWGIVLLIVILIISMVFLNKKIVDNKNAETGENPDSSQSTGHLYYELDDRYIYLHGIDNVNFTYNNGTKELKEWFNDDKDFLNKFLNELELKASANDGGTNLYKDGGTKSFNLSDMVVIVCKRMDGDASNIVYNNNIHIGRNLKYENDVCYLPKKSDIDNNGEVGGPQKILGISMIIKEGTLTNTGATVLIIDTVLNEEHAYGSSFRIEKKENDKWIALDTIIKDYGFTSEAYHVNKNYKLEMEVKWEWLYGKLQKGEYRLIKDFAITKNNSYGGSKEIYAEFTLV